MNSYTKLLTDLINVDVEIDKEDRVVILLNSLPEEKYETFTLTLINGRKFLNYNEVSATLVNYEVRRHDRLSSSGSTTAEALAVRGRSFNRKGRGDQGRLKSRSSLVPLVVPIPVMFLGLFTSGRSIDLSTGRQILLSFLDSDSFPV